MRTVKLVGTDLACSALGFGCAALMGRHGRRASLRALATAADHGVTYFDVARSYGWGAAERVLGEFLRGRREKVVLATKLGIAPPPMPFWKRMLRPVYRRWVGVANVLGLKSAGAIVRRHATRATSDQVRRRQFTVEQARASLETSLRELGTDCVDVLHLHDVQPEDLGDDRFLDFLMGQVADGKVRHLGVATDVLAATAIRSSVPAIKIVQFANSILDENVSRFPDPSAALVTHSPFGREQGMHSVMEAVKLLPPDFVKARTAQIAEESLSARVASLMLGYAFATNPRGVVVCGMHAPAKIVANAAAAAAPPGDPIAALEVGRAIREVLAPKSERP